MFNSINMPEKYMKLTLLIAAGISGTKILEQSSATTWTIQGLAKNAKVTTYLSWLDHNCHGVA